MTLAPAGMSGTPNIETRTTALLGGLGLALLAGVVVLWAVMTSISGAVIARGQVMVEGRPKVIQSQDGGTIRMLGVRDGDVVTRDQLLLRLDPTVLQVNLDTARGRLGAALALRERLVAEQTGKDSLTFSYPEMPFDLPDTAAHEAGQQAIFAARAAFLEGGRDRLSEVMSQFDNQIGGVEGQIAAIDDQLAYVDRDLENMRKMASRQLVRQSALSEMERTRSELAGQLAALDAERARLANARNDSELATLQSERSFLENVVTELREVTTQIEELMLEIVTRTVQLEQTEIRAPAAGVVYEMSAGTLGGVIAPGQTILQILPMDEGLEFEVQVDPRNVDQVYPGQTAQLMMVSLDPQSTPKLTAEVTRVSPDAVADPRTGQQFYRVGLSVAPEEFDRLGGATPVPGMPIEAYLETGERSVMTYLLHPVLSHLRHAFRE